jgi:hypothetical protein
VCGVLACARAHVAVVCTNQSSNVAFSNQRARVSVTKGNPRATRLSFVTLKLLK